jgi:hypothetical protein
MLNEKQNINILLDKTKYKNYFMYFYSKLTYLNSSFNILIYFVFIDTFLHLTFI